MPNRTKGKEPGPTPGDDLPSTEGRDRSRSSRSRKAIACRIGRDACAILLEPGTLIPKPRLCLLEEQIRNQPPKYGIGPSNVEQMVAHAVRIGENVDGMYKGPCAELDRLKQTGDQVIARAKLLEAERESAPKPSPGPIGNEPS